MLAIVYFSNYEHKDTDDISKDYVLSHHYDSALYYILDLDYSDYDNLRVSEIKKLKEPTIFLAFFSKDEKWNKEKLKQLRKDGIRHPVMYFPSLRIDW
jgi:hypothetical protein